MLRSGVPITMLPLDVTHRALATPGAARPLPRARQPLRGGTVAGMLGFSERFDKREICLARRTRSHDPNVIAWLLAPRALRGAPHQRRGGMRQPPHARHDGRGLLARHRSASPPTRCSCADVDDAGFFDLLVERLARLP